MENDQFFLKVVAHLSGKIKNWQNVGVLKTFIDGYITSEQVLCEYLSSSIAKKKALKMDNRFLLTSLMAVSICQRCSLVILGGNILTKFL